MDATQSEQWRPVVGYEGLYEVSDHGRVRSLDRTIQHPLGMKRLKGRLMRPSLNRMGYPTVGLSRSGGLRLRRVHQLVAEAFIGPRPQGQMVRHYNDIKTDNHVSNLRYGTYSDNLYDRVRNGNHYNAEKTHCANGHKFTPENTLPRAGRGGRKCRTCTRAEDRAHAEQKRRRAGIPPRALLTHCKRGHEFTPENTYLNPASGARVCRKCNLIHQRRSQERRTN